jgi:hypothetical protein
MSISQFTKRWIVGWLSKNWLKKETMVKSVLLFRNFPGGTGELFQPGNSWIQKRVTHSTLIFGEQREKFGIWGSRNGGCDKSCLLRYNAVAHWKSTYDSEEHALPKRWLELFRWINGFINFIHQWLYSPLLGPGLFFSLAILFTQTVGLLARVISPSQGRYLCTRQHKHRINTYTHQTSMPWMEFEPTITASERQTVLWPSGKWLTHNELPVKPLFYESSRKRNEARVWDQVWAVVLSVGAVSHFWIDGRLT